MRPVIRLGLPITLLALVSCSTFLDSGKDDYAEGMRRLRYDPGSADEYFDRGAHDLGEALQDPTLEPLERLLAVTLRARCLIELERHTEVPGLVAADIKGYTVDRAWRGDPVGLALVKAARLDPEHAYAELVMAEKIAATLQSRIHLAWEQVHLLQRMGTPKAKAEAIRICEAHAGKLDFDTLKQSLSAP